MRLPCAVCPRTKRESLGPWLGATTAPLISAPEATHTHHERNFPTVASLALHTKLARGRWPHPARRDPDGTGRDMFKGEHLSWASALVELHQFQEQRAPQKHGLPSGWEGLHTTHACAIVSQSRHRVLLVVSCCRLASHPRKLGSLVAVRLCRRRRSAGVVRSRGCYRCPRCIPSRRHVPDGICALRGLARVGDMGPESRRCECCPNSHVEASDERGD